jgi:tRNA threonylcarbamoyladenosine biosynthesis protein TsaB
VLSGDTVAACLTGDAAVTHGERLPADAARALEAAGVRMEDVELLAVAAGPGSFTGLRVGIAAVQGLAFARGLRVVPVPTLDALARAAAPAVSGEPRLAAWLDAQRGEVFAGLYSGDGTARVAAPTCLSPLDTLESWQTVLGADRVAFAGDGALRHASVIRQTLGSDTRILESVPALAPAVARLAAEHADRAVLPHAVVPIYIRRPDAELARERRGETP